MLFNYHDNTLKLIIYSWKILNNLKIHIILYAMFLFYTAIYVQMSLKWLSFTSVSLQVVLYLNYIKGIKNMKKFGDYVWPSNFDICRELIFQTTIPMVIIISVKHLYKSDNLNCEIHGFYHPWVPQVGPNMRKKN